MLFHPLEEVLDFGRKELGNKVFPYVSTMGLLHLGESPP